MTTLLMLLALGAEPADARTSAQPRPYHEINRDLHDALGREARAVDQPDRAAAIVDMADLYVELRRDPRLETSQTLTGYKNRLWSRLTRAKKYLQRGYDGTNRATRNRCGGRCWTTLPPPRIPTR